MKKYLPVAFFLVGLAVFAGVYFLIIKKGASGVPEMEEPVAEIPFEKRPFTSLTPIKDGHWLKLVIENISIEAVSLDYELLYRVKDGRTQGVPGSIKLAGVTRIERELLLGSESSGKFRYDEGVEEGTLTIRFRNDRGKLVGKLTTSFHLQSQTKQLTTVDGKFSFTLTKAPKNGVFFVTMETFGLPLSLPGVSAGPYGVFTADTGKYLGTVNLTGAQRWSGSTWEKVGATTDIGVFVGTSD